MKTSAHDDVPRLSAGTLGNLFRCSHRLAGRLTEEQTGRRGTDPGMRLWSALSNALRAAHDHAWDLSAPLEEAINDARLDTAPDGLSVEESTLYRSAIGAYIDAFGDGEIAAIHPKAGEPLRRRVRTHPPFDMTGRADLLFAYDGRSPLVRRLSLRGSPDRRDAPTNAAVDTHPDAPANAETPANPDHPHPEHTHPDDTHTDEEASIADVALAVLLGLDRGPARNDVVLRSETLWLAGNGRVTHGRVTGADLSRFRSRLYIEVETAVTTPTPTPGWWCTSCERLARCPAVSSDTPSVLLDRLSGSLP